MRSSLFNKNQLSTRDSCKKDRFYIRTLGCQMNVHDSFRMKQLLILHGWELTDVPEEADAIIKMLSVNG